MSEKTPSQTAEKLHSKSQQKIPGRIDLINLPEGMRVKLQNKPLISPEQVAKEEIAVEEGIAREKSREAYIQE